jgi:hypothetical protein
MSLDGISTIRISVMASVKRGEVEKFCVSLSFADEMIPCDKSRLTRTSLLKSAALPCGRLTSEGHQESKSNR